MVKRVRSILFVLLAATGCSGEGTTATPAPARDAEATPATAALVPQRNEPTPPPATPPPPPPAAASAQPPGLAAVHGYTAMFYRGELDLLHAKFTPEMREQIPLDQLSTIHEHMLTNYGKEVRVIGEDAQSNEDYRAFVRWASFDKTDQVIEVQWILRAKSDEIAGFFIRPAQRRVEAEGKTGSP